MKTLQDYYTFSYSLDEGITSDIDFILFVNGGVLVQRCVINAPLK